MKALKPTVSELIDLYNNYLTGGEKGWFSFVRDENNFYTWLDSWIQIEYTTITENTDEPGEYFFSGTLDELTGTFHIINYIDYTGGLVRVLHHIEEEKVYYRNTGELIWKNPTVNPETIAIPKPEAFQSIPLLRFQVEPAETIGDLWVRYPEGGQEGWYAYVDEFKQHAYWTGDNWVMAGGDNTTHTGDKNPPANPKLYDLWTSPVTLIQYQWLGAWVAFVPVTEFIGIIDGNISDLVIDGNLNDGIIVDGND